MEPALGKSPYTGYFGSQVTSNSKLLNKIIRVDNLNYQPAMIREKRESGIRRVRSLFGGYGEDDSSEPSDSTTRSILRHKPGHSSAEDNIAMVPVSAERKRLRRSTVPVDPVEIDVENFNNNPAWHPGEFKPYLNQVYRMQTEKPEENLQKLKRRTKKRYTTHESAFQWEEKSEHIMRIIDIKHLSKQGKPEDFNKVEHLIIEDEEYKMKEVPQSVSKMNRVVNLEIKYAMIKSLPNWMPILENVTQLSVTETLLSKMDVVCMMKQLTKLDLSRNKLSQIPKAIGDLEELQELKLLGNGISIFPSEIRFLRNLNKLDISSNKIAFIQIDILELENLITLDVSRNIIEELPEDFGKLKSLKYLSLSNNRIAELPKSLFDIASLQHLLVTHNGLTKLQRDLNKLQQLELLNVRHNEITTIQDVPPNVTTLLLDCNMIKDVDIVGQNATKLQFLSFKENEIDHIPKSVAQKPSLKALFVDDNPVENRPEVLKDVSKLKRLTLNKTNFQKMLGTDAPHRQRPNLFQFTKNGDIPNDKPNDKNSELKDEQF